MKYIVIIIAIFGITSCQNPLKPGLGDKNKMIKTSYNTSRETLVDALKVFANAEDVQVNNGGKTIDKGNLDVEWLTTLTIRLSVNDSIYYVPENSTKFLKEVENVVKVHISNTGDFDEVNYILKDVNSDNDFSFSQSVIYTVENK